jgi:hypothetical protein
MRVCVGVREESGSPSRAERESEERRKKRGDATQTDISRRREGVCVCVWGG